VVEKIALVVLFKNRTRVNRTDRLEDVIRYAAAQWLTVELRSRQPVIQLSNPIIL